ncbi:uncharacterized protein C21orf58 [Electrophorus electricus]|uniref:uncharacterized protein C21orf58 n=1 Tax=Electrophorus electricus TaxID=8005 RepID=UPI0015D0A5D3|nr:uncharacterized protein C21orf58 [Electrophorus electricus]
MADEMVDQMTRLKLKLLERRLENARETHEDRGDSALSTRSYDAQRDALHGALRHKRDLLRRLREQYMLEEMRRPYTWAGTRRQHHHDAFHPRAPPVSPGPVYPSPLQAWTGPPPPPPPPRIIQQPFPQQPATIIQQLPQQQPLIAQITPPQSVPYRTSSIKEDMVELMLVQNAQMHQIIMHNMMLKALPPQSTSQATGPLHSGQENYLKAKRGAIHHHHHYGPPPLPPIGYSAWHPNTSRGGTYGSSVQHVTGPVTLPPLNT